jgi:hypothetical protein
MPSLAALLLLLIAVDPVPFVPHVRPETATLRALTAQAAARSPLVQELIDQLDRSDVVVYIRHRAFGSVLLDGRIGILSAAGGRRYLVVELACDRSELVQMATLGHELHHALEIAAASSIIDSRTLAQFYARIGIPSHPMGHAQTFETQAAADMGIRVRHELLTTHARSANGS